MNIHDATEQAYRNGYEAGKRDGTPKWIPVTERLPEVGDRYLCLVKSFVFPGSEYYSILCYDKYGFNESGIYTENVTHWMPLPESPGGDAG